MKCSEDRPVHTAIVTCVLTGSALLILGRFVPAATRPSSPTPKWTAVPLADQFELGSRASSPSPILSQDEPTLPRSRLLLSRFWWKIALLLSLCCLRVELFRQVTLNSECAPAGYAVRWTCPNLAIVQAIDFLDALVCHTTYCFALRLLVQPTIATKRGICSPTTIPGAASPSHLFGPPTLSVPIDAQSIQRHNCSCLGLHRWLCSLFVYGRKSIHLRLSGHSPWSSTSTDLQAPQSAGGLCSPDGHRQSMAQRCRQ